MVYAYKLKAISHTCFPSHSRRDRAGRSGNAGNGSHLNGREAAEWALGQAGCAGRSGIPGTGSYLTRAGRGEWKVTDKTVLAVRTRAVRCAPRPFVRTAASREYVSCAPDGFSRTGSVSCARHTSLHGLHGQLRFTQTFLRRAPAPFYRHSSPPALTQNPSAHSRAHGGDAKQRRAEKRMKQE